jgi:hypothetical protein
MERTTRQILPAIILLLNFIGARALLADHSLALTQELDPVEPPTYDAFKASDPKRQTFDDYYQRARGLGGSLTLHGGYGYNWDKKIYEWSNVESEGIVGLKIEKNKDALKFAGEMTMSGISPHTLDLVAGVVKADKVDLKNADRAQLAARMILDTPHSEDWWKRFIYSKKLINEMVKLPEADKIRTAFACADQSDEKCKGFLKEMLRNLVPAESGGPNPALAPQAVIARAQDVVFGTGAVTINPAAEKAVVLSNKAAQEASDYYAKVAKVEAEEQRLKEVRDKMAAVAPSFRENEDRMTSFVNAKTGTGVEGTLYQTLNRAIDTGAIPMNNYILPTASSAWNSASRNVQSGYTITKNFVGKTLVELGKKLNGN